MTVQELTYREAIVAAQRDALEDDPSVLLLGEDIGETGGVFKTTAGLLEKFGPGRVCETRTDQFVARPVGQTEQRLAKEIGLGVSIDGDVVEVVHRDAALVQAIPDRFGRKAGPVLGAAEAFLLGRGNHLTIADQARR